MAGAELSAGLKAATADGTGRDEREEEERRLTCKPRGHSGSLEGAPREVARTSRRLHLLGSLERCAGKPRPRATATRRPRPAETPPPSAPRSGSAPGRQVRLTERAKPWSPASPPPRKGPPHWCVVGSRWPLPPPPACLPACLRSLHAAAFCGRGERRLGWPGLERSDRRGSGGGGEGLGSKAESWSRGWCAHPGRSAQASVCLSISSSGRAVQCRQGRVRVEPGFQPPFQRHSDGSDCQGSGSIYAKQVWQADKVQAMYGTVIRHVSVLE